jgi:hypothetical protein
MTVMGNRRTLNIMVSGIDDTQWCRSEKTMFRTSRGDLHFFETRMLGDGELKCL